jgi:hypothetical protein
MTNSSGLAAVLDAFIRDEIARQLEVQTARHLDALAASVPPAAVEDSGWLSPREAAARVGLHENVVRKARQTGEVFATQRVRHGT